MEPSYGNDQDPMCVKSRTEYLIEFMNCSLLWVSTLQTQITLSTSESEYTALSHSVRCFIFIRGVIQEVNYSIFIGTIDQPNINT